MEDKSMTARVCAFSRAYHSEHNEVTIFNDVMAKKMLSDEEYKTISENMARGILFFNKDFRGDDKEALRWVVDNQLSQTPLARAAFAEKSLKLATTYGAKQYLIFGAGYDTFAYRQPQWAANLQIFEIDHPISSKDKKDRLQAADIVPPKNVHYVEADFTQEHWIKQLNECQEFTSDKVSFCSILGLIYYLSKDEFERYISTISTNIPVNSTIVFDYPNEEYFKAQQKHSSLAKASNEAMKACYSYEEIEALLEEYNLVILEHLDPKEMTEEYFSDYNKANANYPMEAQKNVNYCLCAKK